MDKKPHVRPAGIEEPRGTGVARAARSALIGKLVVERLRELEGRYVEILTDDGEGGYLVPRDAADEFRPILEGRR